MSWMAVASVLVVASAVVSLIGTIGTLRDLRGGSPTYESLADHFGIWSRDELRRLFGAPDADDRYRVSQEAFSEVRVGWLHRALHGPLTDLLSIAATMAALIVMRLSPAVAALLVVVGAAVQGAGWISVVRSALRHIDDIDGDTGQRGQF